VAIADGMVMLGVVDRRFTNWNPVLCWLTAIEALKKDG
jgi:hypothetical protein